MGAAARPEKGAPGTRAASPARAAGAGPAPARYVGRAAPHPAPAPAMADRPDPTVGASDATPATGRERRRNHALRELVDEMLASIRVAANHDLWTDEERRQYEEDLARIMERVRAEATRHKPEP